MVEGNKAPENIKPKEACRPLIKALKDEDEQLVVVNYWLFINFNEGQTDKYCGRLKKKKDNIDFTLRNIIIALEN
jgi:hypothetical protein